jgi:hypothetical protein
MLRSDFEKSNSEHTGAGAPARGSAGAPFACVAQSVHHTGAVDMSYRRFTDSEGRAWEAWEVHPLAVERRMNTTRSDVSPDAERRAGGEFRLVIPRALRDGWLTFQASTQTVRLAPIPSGWAHLSDEELSVLVAQANTKPELVS